MKIVYLAFVRLPTEKAHGAQIMKTCEAFAASGADVSLVVPARRNPLNADPFEYYGVRHRFQLEKIRGPDLVFLGRWGFLLSLLYFSERAHFRKEFWDADVVYSRDALILFQYLLLGRPLVFEAHHKPNVISTIVARRAKKVVVISKALLRAYQAVGVSGQKIVLAPDAVEYDSFALDVPKAEAKRKVEFSPEIPTVLYVGHLYPRKGADVVARAALKARVYQFVFVGGTDEDLAKFRLRWEKEENIRILGRIAPREVPLYLRAADLLVLPNSAKNEDSREFTSPMKLYEYLASGTPIVASRVPSLEEVVHDDLVWFVQPDDPEKLCEGVEQALHSPAREAKTSAAKAFAQKNTWRARAGVILNVI